MIIMARKKRSSLDDLTVKGFFGGIAKDIIWSFKAGLFIPEDNKYKKKRR
jgi:hypothetical protein